MWPLLIGCWLTVRLVRAPALGRGALLGLAVALIAYSDYYLLVLFGLFLAAYLCAESCGLSGEVRRREKRGLAVVAILLGWRFDVRLRARPGL